MSAYLRLALPREAQKAEVHQKHFNDVVRVVIHDFYCCRLLDLSLLHLLCTGGCLAKRVLCVVERGVRWYIDLSGQPLCNTIMDTALKPYRDNRTQITVHDLR